MDITLMHPAEQIVTFMNRIYKNRLTTTSGGNISVRDSQGNIWITPAGVDKGTLTKDDICLIRKNGVAAETNRHAPSIEYAMHAHIYKRRRDIQAVIHAHPTSLVAFSLVHKLPRLLNTRVGHVPYSLPGKRKLGHDVSVVIGTGYNVVMMDNHGAVSVGDDILNAYANFEQLEHAAQTELYGQKLGTVRTLPQLQAPVMSPMPKTKAKAMTTHEIALRNELATLTRRAANQGLFTASGGAFSTRLNATDFLIIPEKVDRYTITEADIIRVSGRGIPTGTKQIPSLWTRIHRLIYDTHADVHAIIGASPPSIAAFLVTDAAFDTSTIPESYMMLRTVQSATWDKLHEPSEIVQLLSPQTPSVLIENTQMLVTATTAIKAFDRLEVACATAKSLIQVQELGEIIRISDEDISLIEKAFPL